MINIQPDQEMRELRRLDALDVEQTMRWESFKADAVYQVKECLGKGEDLVDLINELDFQFDDYDSLSNAEINDIVIEAVEKMKDK